MSEPFTFGRPMEAVGWMFTLALWVLLPAILSTLCFVKAFRAERPPNDP